MIKYVLIFLSLFPTMFVCINIYLCYQCLRYHKGEFDVHRKYRKIFVSHKIFLRERRVSSAACIRGPEHVRGIGKERFIPLAILSFRGDGAFVYNPRDDDGAGFLRIDVEAGDKKCRKTRVANTRNTCERRAR